MSIFILDLPGDRFFNELCRQSDDNTENLRVLHSTVRDKVTGKIPTIVTVLLFFLVLTMAAPVSAATVTIDNTSTIAQALIEAGDGGTVILQPGIYFENSIVLTNSTTIKANTSAGGSAANTVIYAMSSGSIFNGGSYSLTIDRLTLKNGSAFDGGAIHSSSGGTVSVTSCTFTGCTATDDGGAIHSSSGGTVTVTSCTFTGCSADDSGGAIYSFSGGTVSVTSCTFTNCTGDDGGAIFAITITVTSCTFTGCSADDSGGAICSKTVTVTSSDFNDCSAGGDGGAIYSALVNTITVTSSNFNSCTAVRAGGAIYGINGEMHFSRIYNCSTPAVNSSGSLDATNNWWGTNAEPTSFTSENVIYTPWLVLDATATPDLILITAQTSVVRGGLTYNSAGADISGSGSVPDGIPVTFAVSGSSGSVAPTAGAIINGAYTAIFTPSATGVATVSVTVDDETVNAPIQVSSPSSSGGGSNTDTGTGFAENLKTGSNTSFNMDKGAVYKVVITAGTGVGKIMITVRKDGSVPSPIGPPNGTVYEYEDVTIYYADDSDLSERIFYFKVKKSWLSSHGYGPEDIVMMHYNEETGEWEELSTELIGEDDRYYYYSAKSPSFSWFAITVMEDATIIPVEKTTTVATVATEASTAVSTPETAASTETAPPAPAEGSASWRSVLMPALVVVLVVIIAIGLVIRWRKEKYPEWWDHNKK